jgi:butyrate kinase
MYDIASALDEQILELQEDRPTVVFTEVFDARMVEAACHLPRFARLVFLDSEGSVRDTIARELPHLDPTRVEFTLSQSTFVDIARRQDLVDELARAYLELPDGQRMTDDPRLARQWVSEPARFGIMAVHQGHADVVVGGMRHPPRDYFRPLLRILSRRPVVGEVGIFVLPDEHPEEIFPHNIAVFGDVGVNATMTPELLAEIAVDTCVVARDLIPESVLPEINGAIVSYSHKGSDEGPSAELVRAATERVQDVLADRAERLDDRYRSIFIEGEVKVSVALSRRSAKYYVEAPENPAIRVSNVIIAPNLDMGNMLFHLYATRYPEAGHFAVLFGTGCSAVDLPLDCTPENAVLAVKANLLRLHRSGDFDRTPLDTFFPRHRILAINPGSTSTKISIFEGDRERISEEIQHSAEELAPYEGQRIVAQYGLRKEVIAHTLARHGLGVEDLDAVSARGGLLRPIRHGTYFVNDAMCDDLMAGVGGDHASNLGALIARELVGSAGKPTFIVDPVVVDEAPERVKITGFKRIRRKVISHALNQIATAHRVAEENETFYEYVNVVVCHMGGGITVGAHHKGRYIDVNNGLDGEGPFSPQRSGTIPTGQLIDLCFSGELSKSELKKLNKGRGGLIDLLGTADFREVERRVAEGDPWASTVFEAMAYQIAKHITALVPAFNGDPVDRVLLTGGLARSRLLVQAIEVAVSALGCGVSVYPGENEMGALAKGALRVLNDKEAVRSYTTDTEQEDA